MRVDKGVERIKMRVCKGESGQRRGACKGRERIV